MGWSKRRAKDADLVSGNSFAPRCCPGAEEGRVAASPAEARWSSRILWWQRGLHLEPENQKEHVMLTTLVQAPNGAKGNQKHQRFRLAMMGFPVIVTTRRRSSD